MANGTFMRTTDGGASWYFHHQAGLPANNAGQIGQNYDVRFASPTNGIIAGDRGFVGTTSDGGVTITPVTSGVPTTQRCQSISFGDASTGYVAAGAASGSAGTIIKTTDSGATWTTVFTTTNPVTSLVAINPLVVHAVLQNGGVVNTTDGGLTWSTPVPGTVGNPTLGMSFLDSMTGFVVGSAGVISKTTDGGTTWAPLTPPQTNFAFFQMKIISAAEIYAVGAPDFLYKSTDLGSTWTPLPIIPVSGVSALSHFSLLFTRETRVIADHVRRLRCDSTINRRRDDLDIKQFSSHHSSHARYPGGAEHEHSRGRRPSTDDPDAAGASFDGYG